MEGSYLFFSLIEYFRFIMNLDYIIYKSYMKLFYHVCYRTIKRNWLMVTMLPMLPM